MKRYLAILLTLLLAFAFVLPVFAVESAEDEEETMVLFAESAEDEEETMVLFAESEEEKEDDAAAYDGEEAPVLTVGALQHVIDLTSSGCLSEYEIQSLEAKAARLSEDFQMDIVLLVTDDPGSKTPQDYADDYFDYMGYGKGSGKDGMLFLRCIVSRDWYCSTCGRGIDVFNDNTIDYIVDKMTNDLRNDRVGDAFAILLTEAEECLRAEAEGTPIPGSDYGNGGNGGSKKNIAFRASGIVLALIAGIVIALIPMSKLKNEIFNVSFKSGAADYTKPNSLVLRDSRDVFLYTNTTRVRIQTDTSSGSRGGGGGTHVSSSGMTHGGHGGKI